MEILYFLFENFQFLVVKFSIYLNRRVFVIAKNHNWEHMAKSTLSDIVAQFVFNLVHGSCSGEVNSFQFSENI